MEDKKQGFICAWKGCKKPLKIPCPVIPINGKYYVFCFQHYKKARETKKVDLDEDA